MSLLSVKKITEDSIIPTFNEEDHYSIFALEDTIVIANKTTAIRTGISFKFPSTHCCLIFSGLKNLKTLAGLIDSDYRGEIKIIGTCSENLNIKKGDRIAKAFILEIFTPEIMYNEELKKHEEVNLFTN